MKTFQFSRLEPFFKIKKECSFFEGFLTLSQWIKNRFIENHKNGSGELFKFSLPVHPQSPTHLFTLLDEYIYMISIINQETIHTVNLYGKKLSKLYYHLEDYIIIDIVVGNTKKQIKTQLKDNLKKSKLHNLLYNYPEIKDNNTDLYIDITISAEINPEFLEDYSNIVNNINLEKSSKKIHDSIKVHLSSLFNARIKKIEFDLEDLDEDSIQEKILQGFYDLNQYENALLYKEFLKTNSLDYLYLIHHSIEEPIVEKKAFFPVYNLMYKAVRKIENYI